MCVIAPDLQKKMEATITGFLDRGEMFTGYDVTIETRNRERIELKHRDIRDGIHELEMLRDAVDYGHDMPSGQTAKWKKSQITMPNSQWAFVYHPDHLDPKNYTPRQTGKPVHVVTPQLTGSLSIAATQDGPTTDSGGELPDGNFATDCRNRLLIPTRFLREVGFNPGESLYVFAEPSTHVIILGKEEELKDGGRTVITTQKVERNGDIRLSSTTLKAANLVGNVFRVETSEKDVQSVKTKVVEVCPA